MSKAAQKNNPPPVDDERTVVEPVTSLDEAFDARTVVQTPSRTTPKRFTLTHPSIPSPEVSEAVPDEVDFSSPLSPPDDETVVIPRPVQPLSAQRHNTPGMSSDAAHAPHASHLSRESPLAGASDEIKIIEKTEDIDFETSLSALDKKSPLQRFASAILQWMLMFGGLALVVGMYWTFLHNPAPRAPVEDPLTNTSDDFASQQAQSHLDGSIEKLLSQFDQSFDKTQGRIHAGSPEN